MSLKKSRERMRIYQDLRTKIFNGELVPNQKLVEISLAKEYGVNKIHIHEALTMLENDGLVEYEPMKGFKVLGIQKKDLAEIAKIREVLELALFEEFLRDASDQDIEDCKLLTERKIAFLKAGLKQEAFKETTATFEKIYSCSAMRRIVKMLATYREYISIMITNAFESPDDVSRTIDNSTLLYNVLNTRNYNLAVKWIRIRYDNAITKLNKMFQ